MRLVADIISLTKKNLLVLVTSDARPIAIIITVTTFGYVCNIPA
jgi:hypothetical protein